MSHFAQIDDNNIVIQVIVAEQDVINSGLFGSVEKWIQTSNNTYGGIHTLGGIPLRKNYAGINYTYDAGRDAFIPPKPFPSWILVEETCLWTAPVAILVVEGKMFTWNEATTSWVEDYSPISARAQAIPQ
jgi:hypothetical protein